MSRLEDHFSVVNDGSDNGDDFEVVTTPPTVGWPRHGYETGTAEVLKQQRQAISDSGSTIGGLQGLIWRSRHGIDGYEKDNVANISLHGESWHGFL